MQLLWTSKSQVLQLEESSLYGNQSDEVITFAYQNLSCHACTYIVNAYTVCKCSKQLLLARLFCWH